MSHSIIIIMLGAVAHHTALTLSQMSSIKKSILLGKRPTEHIYGGPLFSIKSILFF
jgi:hypothetical protein